MPSLTQHDIHVAHLETVRQFVFQNETVWDHVSFELLIEGKHCNFKKRPSWALNTETNSKVLVQSNECQEFSEDVKRMGMQIYAVHTSFDHFDWNMLKLFRSPKNWILDVYIVLFPLVCGSSQVAHGLCEVPSMKVLTRGMMKEHWWGSMTWVSSWPFIPCYAGHRPLVTKLTHVLVLAMSCCRDPVRFSLIFRSPMVQKLFCSNSHLSMQRHCATAGVSFLAEQTLFPSQPTAHEKGSLLIVQCQGIGGSTGQRNSIWAFWSSLAYFFIWAQQWNCMQYMDYMALMWHIWRQQAFYWIISEVDCW